MNSANNVSSVINIFEKIKKIRWFSSEIAGREKVDFIINARRNNLYPDKEAYWNPEKSYKNHHIYTYIANLIPNKDIEKIERELGIIKKYLWLREVKKYRKYRLKLAETNDIINKIKDEKFNLRIMETNKGYKVEPIDNKNVCKYKRKFTEEANKALE